MCLLKNIADRHKSFALCRNGCFRHERFWVYFFKKTFFSLLGEYLKDIFHVEERMLVTQLSQQVAGRLATFEKRVKEARLASLQKRHVELSSFQLQDFKRNIGSGLWFDGHLA